MRPAREKKRVAFFWGGLLILFLILVACQVDTQAEVAAPAGRGLLSSRSESAAAKVVPAVDNAYQVEGLGADDLLAGVPEQADAQYQSQDAIHEGGRHFFYTSTASPAVVVGDYKTALESAGWTIEDSGLGGDPFGFFSGAGLTATNDARYLKMHAGGPAGKTFIDICIWPAQPNDNNCSQNNNQQTSSGDAALGSGGDLLAGVPEPADAVFKAEDLIQENGRHFFYTSTNAPADVVGNYEQALTAAGWTIEDSGGGGDPFGLFGSGAGLTATNESRYLKMNAGGPPGSTFVDVCVWPSQPSDDNCGQNNNQVATSSAALGAGGALLEGLPEPANANFQAKNAIWEGGQHFWYTASEKPLDMVNRYRTALEAAGWTIEDIGGGGDPFGLFGGGGGLTATNAERYLKVHAGGPVGSTAMDICVWPSQPSDTGCDQDAYAVASGSAALGSNGDLLSGVPELTGAEFKTEDAIQEGGRHFFFTSSDTPANVVSGYEAALTGAGWSILSSGGDPFGLFGAGLTASDGTRYIKFNAGGPGGTTFINACIWPAQPNDNNCGQNNQSSGSATLGAAGSLLSNVPEPAGANYHAQNSIQEGGRHFYYTSTNAPADVVSAFETALTANGWTIEDVGGGGDPFGIASGAGLTATNGARYLKMNAGGPTGSTHIDVCVWPTQPSDNHCGQNSNRNSSGAAVWAPAATC